MAKEDEIMAGYLLKGGKMLSITCPSCGCPQFDYKGRVFCVVCEDQRKKPDTTKGAIEAGAQKGTLPAAQGPALGDLCCTIGETLVLLCRRIAEEEDPERVLTLMTSLKLGVDAYVLLVQR